jgi:hypothetical protein
VLEIPVENRAPLLEPFRGKRHPFLSTARRITTRDSVAGFGPVNALFDEPLDACADQHTEHLNTSFRVFNAPRNSADFAGKSDSREKEKPASCAGFSENSV